MTPGMASLKKEKNNQLHEWQLLNFLAPNVTFNGSLLSGSGPDIGPSRIWTGMESTVFRIIRDVEFDVRVGPFVSDLQ